MSGLHVKRLQPVITEEQQVALYPEPHDHLKWHDHVGRVNVTIGLAKWYEPIRSVADLSAGNASIISAVDAKDKYIGDFAPGYQT
jgi:hypothetical protein